MGTALAVILVGAGVSSSARAWGGEYAEQQIHTALSGSWCDMTAYDTERGQYVGMGRIVGDGLYYLLVDVVVSLEWQGQHTWNRYGAGKEADRLRGGRDTRRRQGQHTGNRGAGEGDLL